MEHSEGMDKPGILAANGAASVLSVEGAWKRRAGCGFGIRQSTLAGEMRVRLPSAYDPQPLDRWMAERCRFPEPPCEPEDRSALGLVQRAAHWVLAVQRREGIGVGSRARVERLNRVREDGSISFFVGLPCAASGATRAALQWVQRAISLTLAQVPDPASLEALAVELEAHPVALRRAAEPGQNAAYIVQHALDADIPVQPVVRGIVRLGTGRLARTLYSSITDRTPSIGVAIAGDKMWTAQVLRAAGLPGAVHRLAASPDAACRIAAELGYPVVVKPADQEQGRGVYADLRDDITVRKAWNAAREFSDRVLVERHFEGFGHRLTIFGDRAFSVTRKLAGGVTGDGRSRIAELIERSAPNVPAGPLLSVPARPAIELDEEALDLLAQQGLSPDSVPAEGVRVALRRRNNAAAGGVTQPLDLETVHPDNLALGLRAARLIGLDWAGVDLLIPDIAVSWFVSGALICEINAQPQVGRAVAARIVDAMVQDGCRIPVHLAIAAGDDARSTQLIHQRARSLHCDGIAMRSGVWIRGNRVTMPLPDGLTAGLALLGNPEVGAALCVMTPAEILENGLPTDRFDSCFIVGDVADPRIREQVQQARRFVGQHLRPSTDR